LFFFISCSLFAYQFAYQMPKIPKSIKNPNQLLRQSRGQLRTIFKHSQALLAIEAVIRNIVPGEIQVASLSKGSLHLVTPSAALATRIKYSQKTLISALRRCKNPFFVKTVRISVRPEIHEQPTPVKSAIPPSEENARYIANAAKYIEDEPLRKALIRLSNRSMSS